MALPQLTPMRRRMATLATFWIPIKKYRKYARAILYMGVGNWRRVVRADKTRRFPNYLSVAAIMKNEGPYLKEWLDFHILVGVDKFYLYDNGSTDNTFDVVEPYVRRGIVELAYLPGTRRQNDAYVDAINRYSNDTRWLALLDLDEFLTPVQHMTVPEFLHTLPQNFGALVLTWVMYGSSGHRSRPAGLVTENFKYHAAPNTPSGCKTIVNPRLVVRQWNPHINEVAGFLIDENGKKLGRIDQTNNPPSTNKLRVTHYITKSYDEYIARGRQGDEKGLNTRTPERFASIDTNDVYDDVMDRFIPELKKM